MPNGLEQVTTGIHGIHGRLDAMAQAAADERARLLEEYRGYKHFDIPDTLQGKAVASAILLGPESTLAAPANFVLGPDQGYCWCVRRLVVDGMATGATPDVVNIFKNSNVTSRPPAWQLSGNQFAQTFGQLEFVLKPGQSIVVASVGTFNSTNVIRVSGEADEVPAERLAFLVG